LCHRALFSIIIKPVRHNSNQKYGLACLHGILMSMKAQIQLSRAIGCEFLARKLRSVMILLSVVMFAVLALAIWLTTVSAWWWLFAVPVILISIVLIAAFVVANVAIKVLRPNLTEQQDGAVKAFINKFERVAEHLQTPMFIIVFRVILDIIRKRDPSFIQTATKDSTTLHKDLLELQKSFK